MSICPICGKVWEDETDTNMGLCSVDCQDQYRRVVEIVVPRDTPVDGLDYDCAEDTERSLP